MSSTSEFLDRLERVGTKLEEFEKQIDDRRQDVLDVIDDLETTVSVSTEIDGPLGDRKNEIVEELDEATDEWHQRIEEETREEEFVSLFDESLIVMVYGKVNSGKSTLGNFLGGLPFEEAEHNPYEGREAEFRVHATTDSEGLSSRLGPGRFDIGGTETTDRIQEFTLGGLTWVDTPGIHAMTEANQELTRAYMESAELVVYLTSSDSPARDSDMEELDRLVQRGKPTLIVVSKFDQVEEDIDPETGEIISDRQVKPDENRREQRNWIEQQVRDTGVDEVLEDRQYCFVSTVLAEEAIREGDTEKFED